MSENKGSLKQPSKYVFDMAQQQEAVQSNRKHNFKMSFEKSNYFETDNGTSPLKVAAQQNNIAKKGSSNVHQVQIGNSRTKNDYKSLTALQQSGHASDQGASRNSQANNYTQVREKIAEQTKDLRSSHFALGKETDFGQASSTTMYQAPPTTALLTNQTESKAVKEKALKIHFSFKDGTIDGKKPPITTTQVNNQIRQDMLDNGQVQTQTPIAKPITSIKYGQACAYTSETKSAFVLNGNDTKTINGSDPMKLRDKFSKPNIHFGTSPNKQILKTVAQLNDEMAIN